MRTVGVRLEVHCRIGLFARQEAKFEVLTKAINAAQTASQRVPNARMLSDELHVLLDCARYDEADENCELCRNFTKLRLKTINLIVKLGAAEAMG
jgi:hypothetical protein